jgi:hypothetical protein
MRYFGSIIDCEPLICYVIVYLYHKVLHNINLKSDVEIIKEISEFLDHLHINCKIMYIVTDTTFAKSSMTLNWISIGHVVISIYLDLH